MSQIVKGLVVFCSLLAVACSPLESEKSSGAPMLEGQWRVESITGDGVIDYSPAQLFFDGQGKLSGNASCNRLFGEYDVAAGELIIGEQIGTTRMMCVPALMNQEQKLLSVLPGTHRMLWKQEVLYLLDERGGEILRIIRQQQP